MKELIPIYDYIAELNEKIDTLTTQVRVLEIAKTEKNVSKHSIFGAFFKKTKQITHFLITV